MGVERDLVVKKMVAMGWILMLVSMTIKTAGGDLILLGEECVCGEGCRDLWFLLGGDI